MGNVCEECKRDKITVRIYPTASFWFIDGAPHIGPSHVYLCDDCVNKKRKKLGGKK